jgi:UDP-N-acetylmuramoyl-tripeptide--D-alanyl-D-alanine ligase
MQALWSWTELSAALGIEAEGATAGNVTGVSIDTRTLRAGDLFVALKDQRDGHDFVTSAFEAGAAAALVSGDYRRAPRDGALFRVSDTLKALDALARAARQRLSADARVIAVTGSAGKTGTKEMLRACLGKLGPTHASEKSYNNHWGVPLTLARMPRDTHYAVLEVGMNHAGEIRPLTRMIRPHAAIITTVEAVHIEYFASVEAIADAKAEIFEGLEPGGAAIIKADNPHAARLQAIARRLGAKPLTFGFGDAADIRGDNLRLSDDGADMTVHFDGQTLPVHLAMPGRHIAENALAVIAALSAVGAGVKSAVAALADLRPPEGRGSRTILHLDGGDVLLIDESYNANPASMRAALATLGAVPRQKFLRRIAVLGDMLELGADAPALHAALQYDVKNADIDLVFACGPLMKSLYDALPEAKKGGYASSVSSLEGTLHANLRSGDAVMVKASNGVRLGSIVTGLKARFKGDAPVS